MRYCTSGAYTTTAVNVGVGWELQKQSEEKFYKNEKRKEERTYAQ